ncbi:MAG: Cell division protein ZapE [Alphaproteobacteria bacterium MarineAlpha11_Bin1]|nr:MAG: Cell division protein ZapE [Alphaproteobacteria bacterium MarineAlpha11_Bin1]|tara:strand:+ start:10440 stop:11573 length:1134 start_codon:yes stop_codon:yes gene_type:complete
MSEFTHSRAPLNAYLEMIADGRVHRDPAQLFALARLQTLWHELLEYESFNREGSWLGRFALTRRNAARAPQGLYLYGPVGRGKSMLMDMLYDSVPSNRKRRVHFHEFMLEVHKTMHERRKKDGKIQDPLPKIAKVIAKETWFVCFDEFQVDNIADAMILGRLFETLFEEGVVFVATSNTHPDNLYKGGLQRDRFLPFIDVLKRKIDIVSLDAERDYRRDRLVDMGVYFSPLGPDTDAAVDLAFAALTDNSVGSAEEISVMGRIIQVSQAAKGVGRFQFSDLCGKPLGAPDYLAIANTYHTVILENIPTLPPAKRNEAKRMVTLIDALYEARVNMVVSAAVEPDELCTEGDTAVAFERTASRLIEMQSEEYIQTHSRS